MADVLRLQLESLKDIFNNQMREQLDAVYILNSILFYCLLFVGTDSCDGETLQTELNYMIKKQSVELNLEVVEVLGILADMTDQILKDQRQ